MNTRQGQANKKYEKLIMQNEFASRNGVVQCEVVEQTKNDLVCVSWRL